MNSLPPFCALMSPPDKPSDSFKANPQCSATPINSTQSSFNSDQQQLPPFSTVLAPIASATSSSMAVQLPSSSFAPKSPPPKILPSPPVSPWVGNNRAQGGEIHEQAAPTIQAIPSTQVENGDVPDPVLYPASESGTESVIEPLFEQGRENHHTPLQSTVEQNENQAPVVLMEAQNKDNTLEKVIDMHMAQFSDKLNKPTRDEYKVALSCIPKIGREYNRNPGAYAMRELAIVEEQFRHAKRMRVLAPAPSTNLKARTSSKIVKRAARVPRTPKATPKRTPRAQVLDSFTSPVFTSPKPPRVTEKVEDVDFESVPNFCPSINTIENARALKTDWKGQPTDLSMDPHRHLLHPAEVTMAATLRLTCAQYLTTKRRIFQSKLEFLKLGNPNFKKTHAQKACSIDVNKASKLWIAFDKVGWFDRRHFEQWL